MTIGTLAARIMADASGIKAGMGLTRQELKITRQAFLDSASDVDKHNTAIQLLNDAYERGSLSQENYQRALQQVNEEFAKTAADEYADKLKETGEEMRDVGAAVTASAGAIAVGLVAIGKSFVDAYSGQEDAEAALRASMLANGPIMEAQVTRYGEFAAELQAVTVIGDEATLGMVQYAESLGVSGKAAERAVKNAIGMGAALGIQEDAAMKMTVALEQGNTTLLQRYIPGLRAITDPTERAAYAQQMLGDMFGVAEAEAQTLTGATAQLTNAIGDAQEGFGKIITKALAPWAVSAKEYVVSTGEMDESTQKLIVVSGAVAAGFATVVAGAGTAVAAAGQLTIWYGALTASAHGAAIAQFGLGAAIGATSVAAGAVTFGAGFAFGQWLYDLTPWGEAANRVLKDVHDSMQAIANIDMSGSTQEGLDQFIASTQRQIEKIQEHNKELQNQQAWYNAWQANVDIIAVNNEQLDVLNANLNRAIKEQNDLNAAQQEATGDANAQKRKAFEDQDRQARERSRLSFEELRLQQQELQDEMQSGSGADNPFLTGMAAGTQEAMQEMDKYAQAIESVNKATDDAIAKTQEQIDTHGMNAEQLKEYKNAQEIARLEEMGASAEQISHLKELQGELAETKRQKDILERTSNTMGVVSMGEAFDIARQGAMRTEPVDRFAGIGEAVPTTTDPAAMEVWQIIANGINALVQKEGLTVEEVSL